MAVQRARVIEKTAAVDSDFARAFLLRRFSPAVVETLYSVLPIFSRGPRKGKPRGLVIWEKCEIGGWRIHNGKGFVQRPGIYSLRVVVDDKIVLDEDANASDEMRINYLIEHHAK